MIAGAVCVRRYFTYGPPYFLLSPYIPVVSPRSHQAHSSMHFVRHFSASKGIIVLFAILACLLLLHGVVAIGHLVFHARLGAMTKLFDVDCEANVPTLYNVLLFFITAALFFMAGNMHEGRARWPWYLMAAIMAFLGVDEGSQIHERFMNFTLRLMGGGDMRIGEMGWLFYAWTIPYLIAAAMLLILLLPWLVRLEARVRYGLLLSGAVYVLGAAGMEAYGGKIAEQLLVAHASTDYPWLPCDVYPTEGCFLYADPWYVTIYTIEETLEMTGLILCIGVLLRMLARHKVEWTVRFT